MIDWKLISENIYSSINNIEYHYHYGYWISRKELKDKLRTEFTNNKIVRDRLTSNLLYKNREHIPDLVIEEKTRKIKGKLIRGYIMSRIFINNQ